MQENVGDCFDYQRKKYLVYNDSDDTDHYCPLDTGSTCFCTMEQIILPAAHGMHFLNKTMADFSRFSCYWNHFDLERRTI